MITTLTAQDTIATPIIDLCSQVDNYNEDVEIVYQGVNGNAYALSVKRYDTPEIAMFNTLKTSIKTAKK
jgi:hypothetical protein